MPRAIRRYRRSLAEEYDCRYQLPLRRMLILAVFLTQIRNSVAHIHLETQHLELRQAVLEADDLQGHTSHERHGVHNTTAAEVPFPLLLCAADELSLLPPDFGPK